jgi:hypothetical protein
MHELSRPTGISSDWVADENDRNAAMAIEFGGLDENDRDRV